MPYQVRYKEPNQSWVLIDKAKVRERFEGNFHDVDLAFEYLEMHPGETLGTNFAEYRYVEGGEEK